MPKIEQPPIKTEEQIEEEKQKEIEAQKIYKARKEKTQLTSEIPLQDTETEKTAEDIYNQLVNVKIDEIPEEEQQKITTAILEDFKAEIPFESDGSDKVLKIYPADSRVSYSLELTDEKGNTLYTISNIKKPFSTNFKLLKGNYFLRVKTEKDNIPFTFIWE